MILSYLADVCGRGSDQLLKAEDVAGRPGDKRGSRINNRLATARTEGAHALHRHAETHRDHDVSESGVLILVFNMVMNLSLCHLSILICQ